MRFIFRIWCPVPSFKLILLLIFCKHTGREWFCNVIPLNCVLDLYNVIPLIVDVSYAMWLPQTLLAYICTFNFFAGTKALNNTHLPDTSNSADSGDSIHFVTVFTIYNASQDSKVIGR